MAADEAMTLRRRLEGVSRPLLLRLHGMPRATVPLATAALLAIGLFAPIPIALPALLLVLLFVGWISYVAWPAIPTSGRVMRLVMFGLVVVLGYLKLTGGL